MTALVHSGVVEIIHGVEVRDPYRWLEDRQLPETEDWIGAQQRRCARYFSENRFYSPLRAIVSRTRHVDVIDQATRVGGSLFLRKQASGQEQAAICVRNEIGNEDKILVDPAAIGPDVSVNMLRLSVDGSLLAYSVRSSGSDAMAVYIADVKTGITLPDCLPLTYVRGFEFDRQGEGFYYCIEPLDGGVELTIRHHRFGEPASSDVLLFSIPRTAQRRLVLFASAGMLAALVTEPAAGGMSQSLFIATEENHPTWKTIYTNMRERMWPLIAQGHLFFLDQQQAPNGRIVEIGSSRVIVPEKANSIQRCTVMQDGFLLSYLVDGKPRIERWTFDGSFEGALPLPPEGSVESFSPLSESSTSLFFLHESYTQAPALWEGYLEQGGNWELKQWTTPIERSTATHHSYWYGSRDGTRIPMVLLEPARKLSSGIQPVILTGYGGFGAAETPRYSRFAKLMSELGVTIARPSIRGGSEFGEAWHQAAVSRKRQTAIDDLVFAAEWLCSEGITDARHLALMGASNGGLLVAAAAMQRPDLFRAVICTGPLTDMLRYELFDHASRWRTEYGTVEEADDFRALLSYSPYHSVREDVDYPAILFVTGDADDRCNPAHVRKMAAILQGRVVQRQPILVDYAPRRGHQPTLTLSERIDALSRKITFLCEKLDLQFLGA